jgi:hypothetical protein|tara:strand:+ start:4912 stop:5412 length:501 start_codon:yes stop_codon:yes gene_type:complete
MSGLELIDKLELARRLGIRDEHLVPIPFDEWWAKQNQTTGRVMAMSAWMQQQIRIDELEVKVEKRDGLELIDKLELARRLGIRDEHLVPIPFDERDKEALLITVAQLRSGLDAERLARSASEKALMRKIKDLTKAKSLANYRSDKAEMSLKQIRNILKIDLPESVE